MVISTPEDQRTVGDELASEPAVAVMMASPAGCARRAPNDELTPTQLATMATLDRLGAQRVGICAAGKGQGALHDTHRGTAARSRLPSSGQQTPPTPGWLSSA